jgi:hypothetical protein
LKTSGERRFVLVLTETSDLSELNREDGFFSLGGLLPLDSSLGLFSEFLELFNPAAPLELLNPVAFPAHNGHKTSSMFCLRILP